MERFYENRSKNVRKAAEFLDWTRNGDKILVLDGGFASSVETDVDFSSDARWSSALLEEDEDAVKRLHVKFAQNGAQVIETNTYQLDFRPEKAALFAKAVKLATEAIAVNPEEVVIVGAVGPFGATLADGSEYDGRYLTKTPYESLFEFHKRRMDRLSDAGITFFAAETLPGLIEAEIILDVLETLPGCRCWLSFQCRDDYRVANGQKIDDVFARLSRHRALRKVAAVGVNCVKPETVASLLRLLNSVNETRLPYVVYPNSGEDWNASTKQWIPTNDVGDEAILSRVSEWISLGARILGGCCRVGPSTIQKLRLKIAEEMLEAVGKVAEAKEQDFTTMQLSWRRPTTKDANLRPSQLGRVFGLAGVDSKQEAEKHLSAILDHFNVEYAKRECDNEDFS